MAANKHAAAVGQTLVVGFDGTEMSSELDSLLTRIQPAGVILFARNIVDASQTYRLLRDCQSCVSTPLFKCVDLEGGRVDRFRDVFGRAPSAADAFATGRKTLFRKHGKLIGTCCRTLGFNTDFAPVVDLALEASRNVMSSRAVSADPKEVVLYAREFLAGLRASRIIGSAKHFPGLGEANLDTHHELPSVRKKFTKLWDEDIYPYRALQKECPMILVGHANYPLVTRDACPASLSKKWITAILRKKIGYRGLVVSDDLEMGGVLQAASIEQAAMQFLKAGGDLCLICHREDYVTRTYETLLAEASRKPQFAREVGDRATRILKFKSKSPELKVRAIAPSSEKIARLKRQLWEFEEQIRIATLPKLGSTQDTA